MENEEKLKTKVAHSFESFSSFLICYKTFADLLISSSLLPFAFLLLPKSYPAISKPARGESGFVENFRSDHGRR